MTKTAHQLRLERLENLNMLFAAELKSGMPSKLYLIDLQQSIADLEVSIDKLAIRGHYEMAS